MVPVSRMRGATTWDWRFLSQLPVHYAAYRLEQGQPIAIDGKLSEPAWASVKWTDAPFVNIASAANESEARAPSYLKVRIRPQHTGSLGSA
eukprot:344996-Pleurochrysis_carterae.AAC.1